MEPHASFAGQLPIASSEEKRDTFKVFIGFDTQAAEAEALATAQYVRGQLADEFDVDLTSWDLAYLGAPRLRERAATEAAAADMIIISSKENAAGVDQLKSWIAKWKAQRNKGGALIALIHSEPNAEKKDLFSLLEKTAQSSQMDFIAKYVQKKA